MKSSEIHLRSVAGSECGGALQHLERSWKVCSKILTFDARKQKCETEFWSTRRRGDKYEADFQRQGSSVQLEERPFNSPSQKKTAR